MGIGPWLLAHGALGWLIVLFQQESLLRFPSNHGQFNTIQGPWVKDNATYDHDPLTMKEDINKKSTDNLYKHVHLGDFSIKI